jgi:hypothetical protein
MMFKVLPLLLILLCCTPLAEIQSRTYRMGFQNLPPRPDVNQAVQTLELWTKRADAAIFHIDVPWKGLIEGKTPQELLLADQMPVVNYFRQKNLMLVVTLDITNGLNRAEEAPELLAAGRSLKETSIQNLYRAYALALAQLIQPDYLGLAAETNLIRLANPSLYSTLVSAVNAAAGDVATLKPNIKRFVSLQVDTAWGRFQGTNIFIGAEQDFLDFPFLQAVGLSSYPYLAHYNTPEDIPLDYLSRVIKGHDLPTLLVEGGWSSSSGTGFNSNPNLQGRYIQRMAEQADQAKLLGVFQLQFADLDGKAFFPDGNIPSNLEPFLHLGLVTSDLDPKPALAAWDQLFARTLR